MSTTSDSTAPEHLLRWAPPAFRRLWLAFAISASGTAATAVALPLMVYQQSGGGAFLTALTVATGSGAYLVWGLIAGAVADRHGRRTVMAVSASTSGVLMLTIGAAAWSGHATPYALIVSAGAVASSAVFFDAAAQGAVPTLVPHAMIPRATSAVAVASTVIGIVVPAAAGAAMAFISPAALLLADGLSYLVTFALLLSVAIPRTAEGGDQPALRHLVLEGIRYVSTHRAIRTMTLVGIAQSAFVGCVVAQFVVFAGRVLGIGENDGRLGTLWTAWSLGGLVATLAVPRLLDRAPGPRIILLATPLSVLAALTTAISGDWMMALACLTALSALLSLTASVTVIYRQMVTPAALLSRVSATARMLAWGLGNPLGALLGGATAAALGARSVLVLAALLGCLATALAWCSSLRSDAFAATGQDGSGDQPLRSRVETGHASN